MLSLLHQETTDHGIYVSVHLFTGFYYIHMHFLVFPGLPKFAPLTDVWSGERFVKDNTIFIKVQVEIKDSVGI